MDPYGTPGPELGSHRRGLGAPFAVVALIVAMLLVSIGGAMVWRPDPLSRVTLPLGGAAPVGLDADSPDETISQVLAAVAPSVTFLTVPGTGRSGSGVVVHEAGYILTNAHVVEDAEVVQVGFHDGRQLEAEVFGMDPATDLAVVRVDARGLPAAALGDSDEMKVGEFVLALGAPFGLQATATSGIISGLHRSGLGIARYEDFIVTDAPINRGNSGGPLVSLRGEVIGINTAIIAGEDGSSNDGTFAGVGFAIPINVARSVAQRLIGDGGLGRPGTAVGGVEGDEGSADAAAIGGALRVVQGPGQSAAPSVAVATLRSMRRGNNVANGTGFVVEVDSQRVLLTNAHVVAEAEFVEVFLGHRGSFIGRVLSAEPGLDLALVSIPVGATTPPPFRLGDAASVAVGDPIVALAGDGAQGVRRRHGEVTNPAVEVAGAWHDGPLIETTVPVERGDSGGPLLDRHGDVVGVVVARITDDPGADDALRSYAIPLRLADEVERLLVASNRRPPTFEPGFRGIAIPNLGVVVVELLPDGLADRYGLKDGDVIVSVDGKSMDAEMIENWFEEFRRKPDGSRVRLGIDGRAEEVVFIVRVGSQAP